MTRQATRLIDVPALLQDPSPEKREELARKVASDFAIGQYTVAEAKIAVDIFRLLLKDAQRSVRLALATELKNCHTTPHDVILRLAGDETEIACQILEHSYVISEDDLLTLVQTMRDVPQLCAIAGRETVSSDVGLALMDKREPVVLKTLFDNKGAVLSENGIDAVWDVVAANDSLLESLVRRGNLPYAMAERLFMMVSDEYKRKLIQDYRLPEMLAEDAISDARDWLTIDTIAGIESYDVDALVTELKIQDRLTHSLLIRALCSGELDFFEAGMARMANVPRANARLMLFDQGPLGFQAMYEATHMPKSFVEPVKLLIKFALEETGYGRWRCNDFRKRVIDRIYAAGYHKTIESMDLLLTMVHGKPERHAQAA